MSSAGSLTGATGVFLGRPTGLFFVGESAAGALRAALFGVGLAFEADDLVGVPFDGEAPRRGFSCLSQIVPFSAANLIAGRGLTAGDCDAAPGELDGAFETGGRAPNPKAFPTAEAIEPNVRVAAEG